MKYRDVVCVTLAVILICFLLSHLYELITLLFSESKPTPLKLITLTNDVIPSIDAKQRTTAICKIPDLDPYSEEVRKFIHYENEHNVCQFRQRGFVKNGILHFNMTNLDWAGYYYIKRGENDDRYHFSEFTLFEYSDFPSVKMRDDFVRLVYKTKDNGLMVEYHMYPIKEPTNKIHQKASRDPNKFNIVMQMIDSMSRASVQRYMKKTYAMLESDPNSVIMKGQTINGEGTLAQLIAILVGVYQKDLPSATLGSTAAHVDSWPFIFRDFHKSGYVSLYSEDYFLHHTFNYKLNGFKNKPTDKFLRTWWKVSASMFSVEMSSPQCRHQFNFEYVKNFMSEYRSEKKFVFAASNLAHNNPPMSVLIDEDMKNFYQFLNDTEIQDNTIVILFGDHGDRGSDMRSTMQGHLEERLPFLSFTFPTWFKKKYRKRMKNLRKNSKVLTTYFDLHVTLKHLLNFRRTPAIHKMGKSLFTDISALNRTCDSAGIALHWCPCLRYHSQRADNFMDILAGEVVQHINKKLFANEISERLCAKLDVKVVNSVKMIFEERKEDYFNTVVIDAYQITLEVSPSDAMFESTVTVDRQTNAVEVLAVSRINIYGDQAVCIVGPYPKLRDLRQYCYCKTNQYPSNTL